MSVLNGHYARISSGAKMLQRKLIQLGTPAPQARQIARDHALACYMTGLPSGALMRLTGLTVAERLAGVHRHRARPSRRVAAVLQRHHSTDRFVRLCVRAAGRL